MGLYSAIYVTLRNNQKYMGLYSAIYVTLRNYFVPHIWLEPFLPIAPKTSQLFWRYIRNQRIFQKIFEGEQWLFMSIDAPFFVAAA